MTPYLDYVAKPSPADSPPSQGGASACGQWAALGFCEKEHAFSRTILCGREWCEDCGQKDSDAHTRRWVRWLPKAQQLTQMGYLVVTFPVNFRSQMRTKEELRDIAKKIKKVLVSFGFTRGLRRWHYFGDCPTHGKGNPEEPPCRCSRGYHPHLNFLLDSGFIKATLLEQLKHAIYDAIGMKLVIHYQFTDVPGKMMHLLKYVTRPTFLKRDWDNQLADALYQCRTTQSWGKWDGSKVWRLEDSEDSGTPEAMQLALGHCPYCDTKVTYEQKVVPSNILKLNGSRDVGMRYSVLPSGIKRMTEIELLPPLRYTAV